jgi:hypothetical protein
MGIMFMDNFSLLHFASGVIANFWGISFEHWFLLHILFEIVENTEGGIYFIDNYIKIWPGGKEQADSLINMIGDQFFGVLGWVVAYYVNQ